MQAVKRYELIEYLFGEQTSRMEGLVGARLQNWAEAFVSGKGKLQLTPKIPG